MGNCCCAASHDIADSTYVPEEGTTIYIINEKRAEGGYYVEYFHDGKCRRFNMIHLINRVVVPEDIEHICVFRKSKDDSRSRLNDFIRGPFNKNKIFKISPREPNTTPPRIPTQDHCIV